MTHGPHLQRVRATKQIWRCARKVSGGGFLLVFHWLYLSYSMSFLFFIPARTAGVQSVVGPIPTTVTMNHENKTTEVILLKGLKYYRQRAGLTQAELASALNVSRSAVTTWELGTAWPSAALLPQIADFLLCSIDDLYVEHSEQEATA